VYFSFIIPMLNEGANIARCLESILNLRMLKEEYEVIVVDNGSCDNSCSIVLSFENRLNLQLLEIPDVNISALRNSGVEKAKGKYLGFIDADCTVPVDWAVNAMAYLQKAEIGIVGCTYEVPDFSWVARTWDLNNAKRRRLGEVAFVPAGCLAVSKEIFLLIDGFDEQLATNEDCDFCFRLKQKGKKVWSAPDIAVVHWGVPKTLWEFFQRQRWHGKDVLKVFFHDLRKLNNLKAVMYATYYLVVFIGFISGMLLYFSNGSFEMINYSLLGLVLLPAILSFRSLKNVSEPKKISLFLKLWLLYLVYGVARATCFFRPLNILSRKKVTE